MSLHRRTVLRVSAATAATALTGGLAGCTGTLLDSSPAYADWLYDPDVIDGEDYRFTYADSATVRANPDRFDDFLVDVFGAAIESGLADTGVDLEDVEEVVWPGVGRVFRAEFDRTRVVDDLTDNGYREADEAGGATVYANDDDGRAVGVLDDRLATVDSGVFSDDVPLNALEELLATGAGERDRYPDVEEDVAELLGHLGEGYFVRGGLDRGDDRTFDRQVASGIGLQLEENYSDVLLVYTFLEADDADPDRVESWVRENEDGFSLPIDLYEVSASADGRSVLVDARAESDELFG
jgi:hypothetical protein